MPQYGQHMNTHDDGNGPLLDTRRWRRFTNGGVAETPKLLGSKTSRGITRRGHIPSYDALLLLLLGASARGRNNRNREAIQEELAIGVSFAELNEKAQQSAVYLDDNGWPVDFTPSYGGHFGWAKPTSETPRRNATILRTRLPKRAPVDAYATAVNLMFNSPAEDELPRRPQIYGLPSIQVSCTWSDYGRIRPGMRPH